VTLHRLCPATLLALVLISPVLAKGYPKPNGWVNDFAGILKESTRQQLAQDITVLEHRTSVEVAVVTVPSLDGETVEMYANKLFKEWGIGKKGKDNGVLILVAPRERHMRIEVGYGLEPYLPDGLAGEVIRRQMLPAFKLKDYDRGVIDGTERVIAIIGEHKTVPPAPSMAEDYRSRSIGEKIVIFIVFSFMAVIGFGILGMGVSDKSVSLILGGLLFGGGVFVGAYYGTSTTFVLLLGMECVLTFWSAAKSTYSKKKDAKKSHRWRWSAPGAETKWKSSGSGSGGFGGGSSGGGGASGDW
jgi:uncharacterized protein